MDVAMPKLFSTTDTGAPKRPRRFLPTALAVVSFLLLSIPRASALAPPYVSDSELAQYPIIVVARWEKSPVTPHNKMDASRDCITICEAHTKLRVERVLKGDLKPGVFDMKFDFWCVGWNKDGKQVMSSSSSMMLGDVDDVTKPTIWFLKKERGWDEKDKTEYLSLSNYREIQPLELEKFYTTLMKGEMEAKISEFLLSDKPLQVKRALRYVCGGRLVFPFNGRFEKMYSSPSHPGKALKKEADNVAKVVLNEKMPVYVRYSALPVYAYLKGGDAAPVLRKALECDDLLIRSMAVTLLARVKDEASIDAVVAASKKLAATPKISRGRAYEICRSIKYLGEWREPRLAPALIAFLETDAGTFHVPQIAAREALLALTGHVFPYQVKKSLDAWNQVKGLPEKERAQALKKLIPCMATPFKAELVGSSGHAAIRITNIARDRQAIARFPSSWRKKTRYSGFCGPFEACPDHLGLNDFKILKPKESFAFKVRLSQSFFIDNAEDREITLFYGETGRGLGLNAWIGRLDVVLGKNWKEKRVIEKVVEKWPNGNLKVVGQKVNGQLYGKWEYFNEAGDRIREKDFSKGTVAECNPEHPSNKGAGIVGKSKK